MASAFVADQALQFDYIIVGAGTAGCLLANRLSADASKRVLLLEAGGPDRYHWIHIPVGYLYCIGNPKTDWCFKTQADPGLNGRALGYPRGRVLGGCSSINGMIYMRGQRADYDGWVAQGNPGWGWQDMLPLFIGMEDHHAGSSAFHGSGGAWRVDKQRLSWEVLNAFRQAAFEVGIPMVNDFNQGDNEGSGYFEVNQKKGWRWNTSKAFLNPIKHRKNLVVLTGAQTHRLIFEGRQVVGVTFSHGKQMRQARAHREVVLAAGAMGSPQLLQLSGVGSSALLNQHGIDVVHELPGVGANLQDHLQIRTVFKVQGTQTLNTMANSLWGKAKMALEYALTRSGPMSMAPSQLGIFTKSNPNQPRANLQYHVQPLSLERFGESLHSFPAITASVCNLQPTSRGQVSIMSADPTHAPAIDCRYLSTSEDRQVAVESIHLTRRILSAPAMAPFRPEEFKPGAHFDTDAAFERAVGDIGTTIFHPVGTCKMGRDAAAVVDADLNVIGLKGLRVADASIMPTITSGNTNSPTLVIAERAAQLMMTTHQ